MNKRPTNRYAKSLRNPKFRQRIKPNKKHVCADKFKNMTILEQLSTIGLAE